MTDNNAQEKRCEFAANCPMFKMFQDKKALSIWQINYCDGNFKGCKRYELRMSGQSSDDRMLPSGDVLKFKQSA